MKKVILIILIAFIGVFAQAQTSKPCAADFHVKTKAYALNTDSLINSLSKWQFSTGVNSVTINLKTGEFSAMTSAGIGLVKSTYKLKTDGLTVYKTYTYGAMLLFGDTQQTPLFNLSSLEEPEADYGIMVVGGYGPISVGPTYFFVSKAWLVNLQVTFTF